MVKAIGSVYVIVHQDDGGLYYWIRDKPVEDPTLRIVALFKVPICEAIDTGENFVKSNKGKLLRVLSPTELSDRL